ncbi:MAG: Gfo/Idh/MocA family oxidoreductase [Gemmatimonadetes bacterium]|nr:Gfo/Idh/MocA family oxidoreductase [Gemmatimonadota bacterium]MBT7864137.1 Gfo/Idh/MocA family oxidoreductase [Gemmatimonadota bacterium]
MSGPRLRVAVAGGAGTWGCRYLRAYAEHPDCDVVAIVDTARDRRQAFADRYGVPTVYDSLDDLFRVDIPDVVSAILPTVSNPDAVIACAEAGVRVISCEKPIAVDLASADAMLAACTKHGAVLGCGSVYSDVPYLEEVLGWAREGHLGRIVSATIPGGLTREASGGGCVQLTLLRLFTGLEIEWVEGWVMPPEPGWSDHPDADDAETDCPVHGRIGLSGGVICEVSAPCAHADLVRVNGEHGQLSLTSPRPEILRGQGTLSSPVHPEFLDTPPRDPFAALIQRLVTAFDTGSEMLGSGRGYQQALEVVAGMRVSARQNHERIHLPLPDRTLRVVPHPYRLRGGDVAGWESIGYSGPPTVETP